MSNADVKEIGKLINLNTDAAEFYDSAKEKAASPQIQTTFANLKALHNNVIINLENILRQKGENPDTDETIAGQFQQFWGEMMAKVSNDVDETFVKHLEEAEDRCIHTVKDIMDNDDVSPTTKRALRPELEKLQQSHDYMKALKDQIKQSA